MTSSRSDVFLTGKNRLRGTFNPIVEIQVKISYTGSKKIVIKLKYKPIDPSKHFIAAPTAVSS